MKAQSRPFSFIAALAATMVASPIATAAEPTNPDSKPLKDRSAKASPDSDRVEDTTRRASNESQPLEDQRRSAGDPNRVQPAGKEAQPVRDDDSKANERSRREVDRSKNANPESTKTEDATARKASPDARRNRDSVNDKADPSSNKVEDTNDQKASPDAHKTSPKDRQPDTVPRDPNALDDLPPAEADVVRAHEDLARDLHQRKIQIQGRDDASRLVNDILGKDSRLSHAELNRLDQSEVRRAPREDRRSAAEFLRQRLRGDADIRKMPPFFRTPAPAEAAPGESVLPEPFFIHEGRRYAFYPSRDDIPAVLLADAALERVRVMPVAGLNAAVFNDRIPAEYRGRDVWVVSYPVVATTTITSHDILFQQGSTQFADGHSYDMVLALTEAILDPGLAKASFAIEGHASAEGTSSDNQLLSQLRAEALVRELVRGGVAADRLVPVGYGESEAHHPADAAENLLRQDRRVVISRIDAPADR
ncbi:OmpA family protein [Luteolibacter soli]|uniref:OmpA family protein n=1 Tax=Luteolibacter soli TaxID=3135280 RepID=A0ABU9B244_9BACT